MDDRKICTLCVKFITNNDFDEMDEVMQQMLDALVPENNVGVTKAILCSLCAATLQESFDFKSMCLNTQSLLSPSCKEKTVCRFCLVDENMGSGCFINLHETKEHMFIVEALKNHIPEMNLSHTEELLACQTCLILLQNFHGFINRFLKLNTEAKPNVKSEVENIGQIESNYIKNEIKQEFILCGKWEVEENHSVSLKDVALKQEDFMEVNHMIHTNLIVKNEVKSNNMDVESGLEVITPFQSDLTCSICVYTADDLDALNDHLQEEHCPDIGHYQCNFCPYQSKLEGDLKQHLAIHGGSLEIETYKCHLCPYTTKRKCDLAEHNNTHDTEINLFKCGLCAYKSKMRAHLKQHMISHKDPSEVKMHKCDLCSFQSKYKKSLTDHQLLVHKSPSEVTMYNCEQCPYTTKRRCFLKVHMITHDSSKASLYKCSVCSFQTKYRKSLSDHVLLHKDASEVIMFRCDRCPYISRKKRNLKLHTLSHKTSSEVEMHKCEVCAFETKHKRVLKRHYLGHKNPSELTMYECAVCGYKTKHKDHLAKHITTRHQAPAEAIMFKCEFCTFQSKSEKLMQKHGNIHKDPEELKTFKCELCQFKTRHARSLRRHQIVHKSHSEVTTYKCSLCPYEAKMKNYLKKHMNTHTRSTVLVNNKVA